MSEPAAAPDGGAAARAGRPSQRGMSLRSRLIVGFAAIAAVAIGVAIVVTASTTSYQVAQLDERLASFAGPSFIDQPLQDLPGGQRSELTRPSDAFRGYIASTGETYVFLRPNVEDAPTSVPEISVADLDPAAATYLTVPASSGDGEFRVLARPAGEGWDVTALSMDAVNSSTQRLILIETIGIALMLAGLALVAWWVIRLGVNPMRRMVDASTRIADGDLSVRLEGAGTGSESAELAASLNAMIGTLTSSLEERERSESRLREFVADASHELRTPLTTVLGYSELHRKGALRLKADQTDAWSRTEAEALRMKRLVDDMLELAKYDAEPTLAREALDLAALAADVAEGAATAFPDTSFTTTGEAVTATVDADRVRQALLNVLTNAATHGGSTVDIVAAATDAGARLTITDDGPGMPPEVAARATERFVRGDASRQRATGGAGLGLAITAAIVEAHGGTLTVESQPGAGTTVTFTLP
ncbi:cell wall metabolism sensor histidine kinase WalK [Demequina sp. NBRC 110056]|uniref:sensor histidine kinase n=1 Tax=Demequina sp. NBRC 110056 TaxID=1570345 RepID=UPI00117DFF57|nr:HAMP domain-containing sensor histidine kinase [Demequina sp. NBRC 110056]